MSIQWKYLDKRSATIAAIKDYDTMRFILSNTERQQAAVNEKIISVGGMKLDGMPKSHNPKSGENAILSAIDEINILEQRYQEAQDYMAWFQPAWDQLIEEEQYILKTFFSESNFYGSNAVYTIADKFCIETSAVYKRKNRALNRMTVLLYGSL